MEDLIQQFFNVDSMMQTWPLMLRGLGMTLLLFAIVIPLGAVAGLLVAVAGLSLSLAGRIAMRI